MRHLSHILIILLCLTSSYGQEANLETRYLTLQEAYTQRLEDIETRHQQSERELLNQFILSLPRMEQSFQEEGNLDGVIAAKQLQEQVLASMGYPASPQPNWPQPLQDQVSTLLQQREKARQENQTRLNELNKILHNALEPYKKAFTQAGNFEKALEIREIQNRLAQELGLGDGNPGETAPVPVTNNDPNTVPFCLEPELFQGRDEVQPRSTAIEFNPKLEGRAAIIEDGFRFENGKMLIPPEAMGSLLAGVQRNQMLSMEIGLSPIRHHQGQGQQFPAIIVMYGSELSKANLAITQEGRDFYLYLRTTIAPKTGQPLHRIHLGPAEVGRAQHISFIYRSGELTVFRNGSEFNKLRGTPTGLLSNWEQAPVIMGMNENPPNLPDMLPRMPWFGHVFNITIRSSMENAREAEENFNRFRNAIIR